MSQSCNRHAIRANVNTPSDANVPRERLVQGKKQARKKALQAKFLIPPLRSQKPCNKELGTIPNNAGTKELKAMNSLKQRKDNFEFGGKDDLIQKLTVFFTSPKSGPVFSEIWKYKIQGLNHPKIFGI